MDVFAAPSITHSSGSSNLFCPTLCIPSYPLSRVGPMGSIRARSPRQFADVTTRLETFGGWSGNLASRVLAECGFIYRNLRDQTQCISCLVTIEGWRWFHDVTEEHRRHSPSCPLVFDHLVAGRPLRQPIQDDSSSIRTASCDSPTDSPEKQSDRETSLCKICYMEKMSVLFLPCAHLLSCSSCSPRFRNCPLCRHRIYQSIKVFISF